MIGSSRSYAIGMVHFQIGGGWRVLLIVLGIYLLIFFGGMAMYEYALYSERMAGGPPPGFGRGVAAGLGPLVLGLLILLQGLALLLVGGYRVSNAIRMDLSSSMLESHRLMPITSPNAVFGYLFGPTTSVLLFSFLNFILCCCFGQVVAAPLGHLVINQGVIICFAVFMWSLVAMGTFVYKHTFFIVLLGMLFGVCLINSVFTFIPAFMLLMTPFLGETAFTVRFATPAFDATYAIGLAGQALLFLLFFVGSCRLYRGTFAAVFNIWQSLALMTVWAVLSALGIYYESQMPAGLFSHNINFSQGRGVAQVTASIAFCIILSVVPLWCFLQEDRRRPRPSWLRTLVVLFTSILIAIPAWGAVWLESSNLKNLAITFIVAAAQAVTLYNLLRLMRAARFIIAFAFAALVMLVVWVGPLLLEVIRFYIKEPAPGEQAMSFLSTLSPLGLLMQVWDVQLVSSVTGGLIWLWLVAGASALLTSYLARRAARLKALVVAT